MAHTTNVDEAVEAQIKAEIVRRRPERAQRMFPAYSFEEMAWFGRHGPEEWEEEERELRRLAKRMIAREIARRK